MWRNTCKTLENLKKTEGMFKEMGMDYWLAKTDEVLKRMESSISHVYIFWLHC